MSIGLNLMLDTGALLAEIAGNVPILVGGLVNQVLFLVPLLQGILK